MKIQPKKNPWFAIIAMVALSLVAVLVFEIAIDKPPEGIVYAEDWAQQYPLQYQSYLKNAEMEKTTFGGSEPYDYLEKYPNLLVLYDGVGFSKEYLRARGHVYALEDVIHTARPKPGASCLSCKTPDYVAMINELGSEVHAMNFEEIAAQAISPISCYDCHKNTPGEPVITRDHLTVALEKVEMDFKMGDLTCAQCHVEYYLHPETKEVILPWDNGITVAGMEKTFDDIGYYDWIHPTTGTPLLKVQHPEFETYQGSLHSSMGLSCIDCHMPDMSNDDGDLFSSHHWTSPLKSIQESCMGCHTGTPDALVTRVETIQAEIESTTNQVSDLIVELIDEITKAVESGEHTEEFLDLARDYHRKAQWRWDFVFVENATGFHNPQFARDTLAEARMYAEKGLELFRQEL
ncbi:cytochrome c-552 [Clostridium aceticum]|uniref:nitrite reductase (cytochrome; ammonia-forming) n=1 Tax=Clostridium aceticum TaxID=84022 RepID=A0A0G3WAJ9_9CLOT|nr:ammonia-forming cytochrome c nitrite reductase subunit c552 [Clostridium aceticum]AKL95661.1 cytochrome c-552 [Clostridium aceticum]